MILIMGINLLMGKFCDNNVCDFERVKKYGVWFVWYGMVSYEAA